MSVKINILSHSADDRSPECEAAEEMKAMLEESFARFPNAKGTINIGYSLTLSGQKVRDIDLLLYGEVEGCVLKSFYAWQDDGKRWDVSVESFCYVVELKDHAAEAVKMENTHLWVRYKGHWKDVSDQSEAQKYSFLNYFNNTVGYKPMVCNMIWFRQVSKENLARLTVGSNSNNALPAEFGLEGLVRQNINQINAEKFKPYGGCFHVNVNGGGTLNNDMKSLFKERRVACGLTRKKLELLTQQTVDKALESEDSEHKLTIFSGRAGTGKTFYLLQTAMRLAQGSEGYRCLILTYNHALVSDIRRLLHYVDIPDKVDGYTVQIQPLHDFFIKLMKELTGEYPKDFSNFTRVYNKCIRNLSNYVNDSLSKEDIAYLKESAECDIDWDYILVDEAQDWSDAEKSVLFKIYGYEHIIVADGIDQFIRSGNRQHWERNVDVNAISKTVGLRQKSNLTTFVNAFAKECGVKWDVKVNKKILGGKVRIISDYNADEHKKLLENCKSNGCENYDILFLVPPKMVERGEDAGSHFAKSNEYRDMGISIFDGTNYTLREQYATKTEECRLFQYDSCRGLEGWCTVCLSFDELIDYKSNIYYDNPTESLVLESPEDRKRKFVYLWSLMPITRPMDTLIITLDNPDSEVGKILHTIADRYPDFVEWDV